MNYGTCTYTGMLSDDQFSAFVDVDFATEQYAAQRVMGCPVPRLSAPGREEGVPLVSDVLDLIPESQWEEMSAENDKEGGLLEKCVDMVKDQDGEPSCVSNATLSALEVVTTRTLGSEFVVKMSPISLYMRCGSRSSGSTLTKNMTEMRTIGALPLDTPENKARFEHTMSHNGYGQRYPEGWHTTAAMFKIAEFLDISSLAEMVTCLLKGIPVIYARSGHCILAIGITYRSGQFFLKYLNSWGNWGAALNKTFAYGVGFDSYRVAKSASYGALAVRNAQLPPRPPVALSTAL